MRQSVMAACILAGLGGPVAAEAWQALGDAEILAALNGRSLGYDDGASQTFRASGLTLYRAGSGQSEGRWRVGGGRYCSVWPPSEHWTCYALERDAEDGRLRFVGDSGDITIGVYHEK